MRFPFYKYILSIFVLFLPQLVRPNAVLPQTEFIGRSEIQYMKWGGLKNGWGDLYMKEYAKIEKGPMGRLDILLDDNSFLVFVKVNMGLIRRFVCIFLFKHIANCSSCHPKLLG